MIPGAGQAAPAPAESRIKVATAENDDNGPSDWCVDPGRGWPKCDACGEVMGRDQGNCASGVFAAKCATDGFTLTFASCRSGHRYCAWDRLHPLPW